MQPGTWRLKCRSCGRVFDVELDEDEPITKTTTTYPCPGCGSAPCDRPLNAGVHWHDILDFIVAKER
jgi:DNA-directed RNA polymerase subunit RPC12/RpoP